MHSVRIELAKLILVGTRTTDQATGDIYYYSCIIIGAAVNNVLTTWFSAVVVVVHSRVTNELPPHQGRHVNKRMEP